MKKMISTFICILAVSSCSSGNTNLKEEKIAGEHANVVVEYNLEPIHELYSSLSQSIPASLIDEKDGDKEDFNKMKMAFDLVYQDYEVHNFYFLASAYVDFEKLEFFDSASIDGAWEVYEEFIKISSGEALVGFNNSKTKKLMSDFFIAFKNAGTLTEGEREKSVKSIEAIGEDIDDISKEEMEKLIIENVKDSGVAFFEHLQEAIGEEDKEKFDKYVLANLTEKEGDIFYKFGSKEELGGNLRKNKNYQEYKKILKGEVIGTYYVDYTEIFESSLEKKEFSFDDLEKNINNTNFSTFGVLDLDTDGATFAKIIFESRRLGINISKDKTKYIYSFAIATPTETEAKTMIKKYKERLGNVFTSGLAAGFSAVKKPDFFSKEESLYLKEIVETTEFLAEYKNGHFMIGFSIDVLDDTRFQNILNKSFSNMLEKQKLRIEQTDNIYELQ